MALPTNRRIVMTEAGIRNTIDPKTHMNAPATIWSDSALIPNGRAISP